MTQEQALSILKTGTNVFLTGEPGSGKTHTVNQYVAYLRTRNINTAVTASTGIAATHIGGMTIHSWSGIGIRTKLDKQDLSRIATNRYIAKRIKRAKVLIIDEVSMLAPGTLSMVDQVCRGVKQNTRPFGGIQVLLVGDFFQLPPIVKASFKNSEQPEFFEESAGRFAYDSSAWIRADLSVCYLAEQHRQEDGNLLSVLSAIRGNSFDADHLRCIETRKIDYETAPENSPKLFSHNADIDRINNEMLAKLAGSSRVFSMSSRGPDALVETMKRGCLSPQELCLKVGATVMFTKNNPKEKFVNGTLGTVKEFNQTTGSPIIETRSGKQIEVLPMDWTVEENGKIWAQITQLPLRLAWAITIHKSQGMSLDEAIIDLSQVFEFGQGYVALSRVRKLSGLYLLGYNERAFRVHPDILNKDASFRTASQVAEASFANISSAEFRKMRNDFAVACGGKDDHEVPPFRDASESIPKKGGISFEKIRQNHPNAYRPWDEEQDEGLKKLFAEGASISELVKVFGRKRGAIKSRIVRIGLAPEE